MLKRKPKAITASRSRLIAAAVESLEHRNLFTAIAITQAIPSYTQDFTGASATDTTIPAGWLIKEGGSNANQLAAVNDGSLNSGNTYMYASSGSTDRAYGTLRSGSLVPTIGAIFRNDTSTTITDVNIKYDGELWRLGAAGRTDSLNFGFRVSATEPTDPLTGTFTAVSSLNFSTPNTTGTAGARNGNLAANRTADISSALPSLSWAPGEFLIVQWTDADPSGSDDGLAVDNFTLTANGIEPIPAPGLLTVSTSTPSVNEAAGTVTFTVSRTGGTTGTVSADVLLTAGSASTGDFGAASVTSVTFADGDNTPQTFTVPIINDTLYELTESFNVGLTNPQGTSGAPTVGASALVGITNDSDTPIHAESFESEPGTGYTLEGPFESSSQYNYFGRYDRRTAGYPQNTFSGIDQNFSIQGETHNGLGFGPDGADPTRTIALPGININNSQDLAVIVSLGAYVSSGTYEDWGLGDGISIYATIDGGERTLIGQFKTAGLTGKNLQLDSNLDGQGDGTGLTTTLQDFVFPVAGAGQTLSIEIDATSGGAFQSWAMDNVRLSGTEPSIGNTPPTITSNGGGDTASTSIEEGNNAVTTVTAADTDAGQTLTYSISTDAGEANEDSSLFAIDPQTGELAFHVAPDFAAPLDLNMDNVYRVTVVVSDGAGGTDTQQLSVTITKAPTPGEFSIGDAIANETDGTVTLTVTRANGSDGAIDVSYATNDDTALAGSDYTATGGVLSFADGETEKTITVDITNDTLVESAETFTVVLSGAGVNLIDDTAVVTINSDDVYATVQNRLTFYNNSFYDTGNFTNGVNGNRAKTNDDAIATDKVALRTGTATFANYTSYDKGINGIIVDLANVPNPASISASDFIFANTGRLNGTTPTIVTPTSVTTGVGPSGTTRVYITFADSAVTKTWLRTTVLANANTNLQSNDVFYFGNAIGDSGNSTTDATVNSSDDVNARNNPRNPGQRSADQTKIDLNYDYNRDGLVNSADQVLPRNHATNPGTRLGLITI